MAGAPQDEDDALYLRDLAWRLDDALPPSGNGPVSKADVKRLYAVARRLLAAAAPVPEGRPLPGRGLVRHERLDRHGGTAWLLVVEAGLLAAALAVEVRDNGAPPLLYGGVFSCGAARASAHGLLSGMPSREATPSRMAALGLPTDDAAAFSRGVVATLARLALDAPRPYGSPAIEALSRAGLKDGWDGPEPWFRGYLEKGRVNDAEGRTDAAVAEVAIVSGQDGAALATMRDAGLDAWIAEASAALRPSGLPWPGHASWSCGAYAFFAAGGEPGLRRRQAARIVPALAHHFHANRRLAGAIDAGRPLFEALVERFVNVVPGRLADGFTPAKLRRLRTLDRPLDTRLGDNEIFSAIAATPLHLLPRRAEGWGPYLRYGAKAINQLSDLRIEPAPLLCETSRLWLDPKPAEPHVPGMVPDGMVADLFEAYVTGLHDMLSECALTLLADLGAPVATGCGPAIAARLLLKPYDLSTGLRLQARWHEAMAEFRAVQAFVPGEGWPALFEPFAFEGVAIACLTDARQLHDEGAGGIDGDGRAGLDHCVGGYVPRCAARESHVASVRAIAGDGPGTRLSTIEITLAAGRPRLAQHRAHRNAEPPPEARRAVSALMAALADGSLPFRPEGPTPRASSRPAWSLDSLFEAWRPYLPPRIARAGLPALRAHLAADPTVAAAGGLDPDRRQAA